MPEQQLLKPTEWSYCDYFWVSPASVSLHCDPNSSVPLGRAEGAFLVEAAKCGVQFGISDRTFAGFWIILAVPGNLCGFPAL